MRKTVLLVLMALATVAQASYVETCVFEAELLEDTSTVVAERLDGTEEHLLHLNIKVHSARPDGRADSGCSHFKNQQMQISMMSNTSLVALKRGERIKLRYLHKDNAGMPAFNSYQILN